MSVTPSTGGLRAYTSMLARRWAWVLLGLVIAAAGAVAYVSTAEAEYRATAQLFVSSGGTGEDVAAAYQGGLLVQQRIRSYAEVVDSPAVLEPVIDDLDLDSTPADLAIQVSASTPPNTTLLNVTATAPDAEAAADIANATGAELAREIVDLEERPGQVEEPVKVTLINPAEPPQWRSAPPGPRTVGVLAGILGLALGLVLAATREALDTSVSNAQGAQDIVDVPLLGMIPSDSSTTKKPLLIDLASHSPRAEAYKALRTNLRFTDVEHDLRVMVVTSSVPDEGKTTVAANLALSLAQLGRTVLLVEGELRDPGVLGLFGMPEGAGLTDVLLDNTPVSDVIQTLPGTELNLLAAGQVPPNPSELLGSRQMIGLLEELRASYETIIIDAPPLLPVTDAAVLAEHADGALLVVREGKTRKDQLARAKAALDAVEARVLGVVMNRARVPKTATTPYSQAANSSPARRRADARRKRTRRKMHVAREPHHHSRQAAEAKPLADSTR